MSNEKPENLRTNQEGAGGSSQEKHSAFPRPVSGFGKNSVSSTSSAAVPAPPPGAPNRPGLQPPSRLGHSPSTRPAPVAPPKVPLPKPGPPSPGSPLPRPQVPRPTAPPPQVPTPSRSAPGASLPPMTGTVPSGVLPIPDSVTAPEQPTFDVVNTQHVRVQPPLSSGLVNSEAGIVDGPPEGSRSRGPKPTFKLTQTGEFTPAINPDNVFEKSRTYEPTSIDTSPLFSEEILSEEIEVQQEGASASDLPEDALSPASYDAPSLAGTGLDAMLDPYESATNNDFEEQKTEVSEFPYALLQEHGPAVATLEGLSSICMGEIHPLSPISYTIGRSPRNMIVFSDRSLSRRHVELVVNVDGRAIVQDLGSSNGTYLNGHRISKADLRDGDQLKMGEAIVRFTQVKPLHNLGQRRVLNELNEPIVIDELRPQSKRRNIDPLRVVVISAILVSLLVAVMLTVFVAKFNQNNAAKQAKKDATVLYLEGVSAMRDRNWDRAELQFNRAKKLDPAVPGLHEQFLRIKLERVNSKRLDNAVELLRTGDVGKARRVAAKIPRDSIYYGQARKLLLSID